MEDQFDFQIDYENMPSLPIIETPANDNIPYRETEIEGKKVYMCSVPDCGKVFKYPSQVSRHSIIHKKDRPYSCTFEGCNKSFKRADMLESHMQLHTTNLSYVCDEPGCDQSFTSKPALNYHKTKHANNRIFKCEFKGCGKSFLSASQLSQHEKAVNYHSDDMPQLEKNEGKPVVGFYAPDEEIELQILLSGPCTEGEWRRIAQKCQGQKTPEDFQESVRLYFNNLINENLILREQAKRDQEDKKHAEINTGNFIFSSTTDFSPFSELARLSECLDSDELKFLEYLKENADSKI